MFDPPAQHSELRIQHCYIHIVGHNCGSDLILGPGISYAAARRKKKKKIFEKRKPFTVGGNVNWYNHCEGQVWKFLKKLKIELPYDPAVPLLGIYLDKTIIQKNTCIPVFTGALFTIAKT